MGNAFTFLKAAVASLDRDLEYRDIQTTLCETLQAYEQERIDYADQAIADLACQKLLKNGDVILTFGNSQAVSAVLQLAKQRQKNFSVIVVDSRPLLEGRDLLYELRKADIDCSYILLNALTYVLQDVTKVLLGASALMSDGSIVGRVGSACVALAAKAQHIPVLVCSETYKISNRVQLESITNNELGDPEAIVHTCSLSTVSSATDKEEKSPEATTTPTTKSSCECPLSNWKHGSSNLKLLNLTYDLTPADFVSGIVTELGIVPPTSVAVLLREMNPHDIRGLS